MTTFDSVLVPVAFACLICVIQAFIATEKGKRKIIILLVVILCITLVLLCFLAFYMQWESSILGIHVSSPESNVEVEADSTTASAATTPDTVKELMPSPDPEKVEVTSIPAQTPTPNVEVTPSPEPEQEYFHLVLKSYDNLCGQEGHGPVKNEHDLGGFLFDQEGYQRAYYHYDMHDSSEGDKSEPLHHVILDFSHYDFRGMAINIQPYGEDYGLNIVMVYEGGPLEFWVSEGHYTITASAWDGDVTHDCAAMEFMVDHCGTYTLS